MRNLFSVRWPVLLLLMVALSDGAMFAYLRFGFSPGWPSDALAHTLNARLMVDSLTPGFSQLGFWPPLLHLLLVPAASIDLFYRSDTAGFVTLFPVLFAASFCLFSICHLLTGEKKYGWFGVTLFLLNPYVLYFSTAAMTEVLFIAFFLGFLLCWLRWMKGGNDGWALWAAVLVSGMYLSRYEGLLFLPASIPLFFGSALLRRISVWQALALTLMCAILASLGLALLLIYGLYYGGDPLAFLSIGVRSSSPNAASTIMGRVGSNLSEVSAAWSLAFTASTYLFGGAFWWFGCGLLIVACFLRRNALHLLVLLLACVPFLSMVVLLTIHRAIVGLPGFAFESSGFIHTDAFHNTRYLLPAILLPVMGTVMVVSSLGRTFLARFVRFALVCIVFVALAAHGWRVLFIDRFNVIRNDITYVEAVWDETRNREELPLDLIYDYGFVLSIRYFEEVRMLRSHIPLSSYVHEGTYHFIRQALQEPWLFARFVIVNKDARGPEITRLRLMAETPEFDRYYVERYRDLERTYYVLNEDVLRAAAASLGYDPLRIPSLNPSMRTWDPANIYRSIRGR